MNSKQYLDLAEKELKQVLEIIKRKNADYTGGSEDALANFKLCEQLGVKAEHGVLIRMMDKMQRINSYLSKGSLEVKEETVLDAIRDIIGYAPALIALIDERPKVKLNPKTIPMSDLSPDELTKLEVIAKKQAEQIKLAARPKGEQ